MNGQLIKIVCELLIMAFLCLIILGEILSSPNFLRTKANKDYSSGYCES